MNMDECDGEMESHRRHSSDDDSWHAPLEERSSMRWMSWYVSDTDSCFLIDLPTCAESNQPRIRFHCNITYIYCNSSRNHHHHVGRLL